MLLEPARLVLTREDGTVDCGLEYLAWCRFFGIPLSPGQNKAEATKLRAKRVCPIRRRADQPYEEIKTKELTGGERDTRQGQKEAVTKVLSARRREAKKPRESDEGSDG